MTLSSGGTEQILELSNSETLNITGGTLQIDNDSTVEGTLGLAGGTLTSVNDLTLLGTFNWSGGTVQGSGGVLTTNGATAMNTAGARTLTGIGWDNFGTWTWTGGDLTLTDAPAVVTNKSGAVFSFNSLTLTVDITGAGSIVNEGTWLKPTDQTLNIDVAMANSGLLDIDEDGLFIDNLTNTGTIDIASGFTLSVESGSVHTLDTGTVLSGDGFYTVNSGTLDVTGAVTVPGTLTLRNLNAASIIDNAQNLTIDGTFGWSGGTVQGSGGVLTTNGATAMNTAGARTLTGIGWDNFGTWTWTGGDLTLTDAPAVVTNKSGAVFSFNSLTLTVDITGAGSIVNEGTWLKPTDQTLNIDVAMANSGLLDIDEDGLFIDNLTNTGTIGLRFYLECGTYTGHRHGVEW